MYRVLIKNSGSTLLETVIALGLFLIIASSGTSLLLYANNVSGRISVKNELLENARITLDFMVNQLRLCEEYYIEANGDALRGLIVSYRETENSAAKEVHEFRYSSSSGVVSFGNQRLAGYIREIRVEIKEEYLILYVTTRDRLTTNGITSEPITLEGIVALKGKEIFSG